MLAAKTRKPIFPRCRGSARSIPRTNDCAPIHAPTHAAPSRERAANPRPQPRTNPAATARPRYALAVRRKVRRSRWSRTAPDTRKTISAGIHVSAVSMTAVETPHRRSSTSFRPCADETVCEVIPRRDSCGYLTRKLSCKRLAEYAAHQLTCTSNLPGAQPQCFR